jgi:hypothetical protein
MSIEKIKRVMKMIEENNFNLFEIDELPNQFSTNDFNGLIKSKNGKNKNNSSEIGRELGAANFHVQATDNIIKNSLSGVNKISVSTEIQIPDEYINAYPIFDLYDYMRSYNVLPELIHPNNIAEAGYTPEKARTFKVNNLLSLNNTKEIILFFNGEIDANSDPNSVKLLRIQVNLGAFDNTLVNDFAQNFNNTIGNKFAGLKHITGKTYEILMK